MEINSKHPVTFDSQIEGVSCKIKVTWYIPAVPAITDGPMENAQEMETSEFEFEVVMNNPWEAANLQSDVTDAVEDRLFNEFEAYLLAQKHGIDF